MDSQFLGPYNSQGLQLALGPVQRGTRNRMLNRNEAEMSAKPEIRLDNLGKVHLLTRDRDVSVWHMSWPLEFRLLLPPNLNAHASAQALHGEARLHDQRLLHSGSCGFHFPYSRNLADTSEIVLSVQICTEHLPLQAL